MIILFSILKFARVSSKNVVQYVTNCTYIHSESAYEVVPALWDNFCAHKVGQFAYRRIQIADITINYDNHIVIYANYVNIC